MNLNDIFAGLAELQRWVPYRLVWNAKRQKYDKVPHNGRKGLSTKAPNEWTTLAAAFEASSAAGLSGVGLVMTGGIELAGWTLVGFDYDGVTKKFKPLCKGYLEKSPSGTGRRSFAWVPTPWAQRFRDTTVAVDGCHHCEIYLGSAPRFLTITFDVLSEEPIPRLSQEDLMVLEGCGLLPRVTQELQIMPGDTGQPLDLARYSLTPDQQALVKGEGDIDRSAVLHGLLVKLLDAGASKEDALATIVHTPTLWNYCLSHRSMNESKAYKFAGEEIVRAFSKTQVGMRQALVGFNEGWKPNTVVASQTDVLFPDDLFDNAPGLVGEIARWIHTASYAPRKEFSYACALSMVACLTGTYCTFGSRKSKMNLYLCMVGGTGTGKNEAMDNMALLLSATDAKDCIMDFPASESALRRQLSLNPNVLIRADELAHKFESMRGNANGSGLGKMVLEMYNGARLPPKPYADEKKSLEAVENPYVQILGGTTGKVWEVLRTENMEDGTLNRFLFVCLPGTVEYNRNHYPSAEIPNGLLNKLNAYFRCGRMHDLIGYDRPGFERKVTFSDEVGTAIQKLDRAIWELQQKDYGSLYSRFVQNTMKISALLALSDGKKVVTLDYFEQARRFVKWCVANTHYQIKANMADSNFERQEKKLIARLEKQKGKMSVRDAYRHMHITRREMEELLATLVLGGVIATSQEEETHNGKSAAEWIYLVEKEADSN